MSNQIDAKFPEKLGFLFKPQRYKVAYGGRGCVHPDTLIDTPNGQVKISDFHGGEVYSWQDGEIVTAIATKPKAYTVEQLYRVDFADGRSIIVTDEHKFLTQRGWVELQFLRVSDSIVLLPPEFDASHLRSIVGISPQALPANALHCSGKCVDYQGDYSVYSRLYDLQPLFVARIALSSLRLLSGVLQHIRRALMRLDDRATSLIRSLLIFLLRQPNLSCPRATVVQNYAKRGSYNDGISFEQPSRISQQSRLFHGKNNPEKQARHTSEQSQGFDTWLDQDGNPRTISDIAVYDLHDNSYQPPCNGRFILSKPRLVSKHSRQTYWDLHVAVTNNYLSNGIVNHNSGKSWGYARALLIKAAEKPLRVLCGREIQKSIKQSVHTLLADQIQALSLGQFYTITESEIRGKNGSSFSFAGLATHTVESIKSFEGVDICWIEEAQTVSRRSWDILIPTIRKPSSEIWVSFNPDLDTDDTYTRFVENPPDTAIVVKINYNDNPWFPDVLDLERIHCKNTRPQDYANIWEGECKAAVEGAIYAQEIVRAQEGNRVRNLPYDPMLKVHVVFDLGWNDSMAIILCQRNMSEVRIVEYIEEDHKTLDYYSSMLKDKRLNWGEVWLPHDGASKDFKYGKSAQDIMQALGWNVKIVPRADIEHGIKASRMVFNRVYFDKEHTGKLINCLKRYRRSINIATNEPGAPLHDEHSHGADCFRYMCMSLDRMGNESVKQIVYPKIGIV